MRKLRPAKLLLRFLFLLFLFIGSAKITQAQRLAVGADKGTNDHVLYLEFGGAAYFYSVNYERLLFHKNKYTLFGRLGFEYIPFGSADRMIHFPIGANFTIGERKHRLELGLAALFRMNFDPGVGFGEGFYLTNPPTRIFIAPSAGWRFHVKPNEWGETFFLRVTFTPIIGLDVFQDKPYFLPHFGVSVGRTWNNQNRKGR
ncbi:MAG: hypothetical protein JKX84_03470 [Flavobacteriales bacterium]|nr:hypothetical protein [Flavobacteriales bacterium]